VRRCGTSCCSVVLWPSSQYNCPACASVGAGDQHNRRSRRPCWLRLMPFHPTFLLSTCRSSYFVVTLTLPAPLWTAISILSAASS
jgi:hypothetical protein